MCCGVDDTSCQQSRLHGAIVVLHCLKEEVCSNPAAVAYQEEETPYFFFFGREREEGRGRERKGEEGRGGRRRKKDAKRFCGS